MSHPYSTLQLIRPDRRGRSTQRSHRTRGSRRDHRSRRNRGRRHDHLSLLSLGNLIALLLLWALESRIAERYWLTTALTYLPQQPFAVPTVLMLSASVIGRNARAIAINFLAGAFMLFTLLGFRVPPSHRPAANADLRVLSYNIHLGTGGLDRPAEVIGRADADLVCLQEAIRPGRSFTDAEVAHLLPGYHVERTGDLLTASRLPVENARVRRFRSPGLWRTAQQMDIRVGGRTVHIVNIHFQTGRLNGLLADDTVTSPSHWREGASVRLQQAEELLGWIDEMDGPVVVMGDFNTPPRGLVYGRLARRMENAFHETGHGFGYTWNTRLPVLRIDHVFTGNGATPVNARVLDDRTSDHRPVVAGIALSHRPN